MRRTTSRMTKTSFIFLVPLLAPWVSLCAIHQQPAKLPLQQRHYLLAKQLIEDNCVDCMGGTKAGMENGIQEMQAALATGFADDKAAYKLLADAYNAMTTYVRKRRKGT